MNSCSQNPESQRSPPAFSAPVKYLSNNPIGNRALHTPGEKEWGTRAVTCCVSHMLSAACGPDEMERQGRCLLRIPHALSGMRARRNGEPGPLFAVHLTSSQLTRMLHLLNQLFCVDKDLTGCLFALVSMRCEKKWRNGAITYLLCIPKCSRQHAVSVSYRH